MEAIGPMNLHIVFTTAGQSLRTVSGLYSDVIHNTGFCTAQRMIFIATFFSLIFPIFNRVVCSIHPENHITIFTIVVGQNPTYGYNASGPMLDIAFDTAKARYPIIFTNITLVRLYNAAPVAGCVETGDIMPAVAGTMFKLMDKSKGFPVIISPGQYITEKLLRCWLPYYIYIFSSKDHHSHSFQCNSFYLS